jgi:hypothetical protein
MKNIEKVTEKKEVQDFYAEVQKDLDNEMTEQKKKELKERVVEKICLNCPANKQGYFDGTYKEHKTGKHCEAKKDGKYNFNGETKSFLRDCPKNLLSKVEEMDLGSIELEEKE